MSKKLQIILFLIFILLSIYVKFNPIISWDLFITQSLQSFNVFWFDLLMKFISKLGNHISWGISLLAAIFLLLLLKKKKDAFLIFTSTLGALFLSEFAKIIIARPRPDPTLIYQFEKLSRFDSFPSGHVLFAMGFYGFIFYLIYKNLKKGLLKNLLLVSCILVILLMGLSRVYLGSHWFSDVLGSYLIGIVWLILMASIYKRMQIK